MKNEEYKLLVVAQELVKLRESRASFLEMQTHAIEMRNMLTENSLKDPVAAGHVINLLNQRLATIEDVIAAYNRLIEIVATLGEAAAEPFKEMDRLLGDIQNNIKVIDFLTREAMKISPGSVIRGEGQIQ